MLDIRGAREVQLVCGCAERPHLITIESSPSSDDWQSPARHPAMTLHGEKLARLEDALGGPTVNRIVNDDAWKRLTNPPGPSSSTS